MPGIQVQITRFVDTHQPGIVECQFLDAHERVWLFVEKVPVVTTASLWTDSEYPQPGVIEGVIVGRRRDSKGETFVVDTQRPHGVESVDGATRFEVRPDILVL